MLSRIFFLALLVSGCDPIPDATVNEGSYCKEDSDCEDYLMCKHNACTSTGEEHTQGECAATGDSCTYEACCTGSICVGWEGGSIADTTCADECGSHEDCASGCCDTTEDGYNICSPVEFCE